MRGWLFLALVGCAQAGAPNGFGLGNHPDGGNQVTLDSPSGIDSPNQQIDAPMIDAPRADAAIDGPPQPTSATLDENSSDTPVMNTGISCANSSYSTAESYYRVFPLNMFGVSTAFTVNTVTFGVEYYTGPIPVSVDVGTYTGTVGGAQLTGTFTPIVSNIAVSVPNTAEGDNTVLNVPITGVTIPAGKQLYVEIDVGDGSTGDYFYYPGANTAGENQPSYLKASQCGDTTPADVTTLSSDPSNTIIRVTGTY